MWKTQINLIQEYHKFWRYFIKNWGMDINSFWIEHNTYGTIQSMVAGWLDGFRLPQQNPSELS